MPKKISPLNVFTRHIEIKDDDWGSFADKGGINIDDAAKKSINRIADELYADTCFDRYATRSADFRDSINSIHRNAEALWLSLEKYDLLRGLEPVAFEKIIKMAEHANKCDDPRHSMEFNFEIAKLFRDTPNKTEYQYFNHLISQHIEAENSDGEDRFESDHASIFFFSSKILAFMNCLEAIRDQLPKFSDIGASTDENLGKFLWNLREVYRQCGGDTNIASAKFKNFAKRIYDTIKEEVKEDTKSIDGIPVKGLSLTSIRHHIEKYECG